MQKLNLSKPKFNENDLKNLKIGDSVKILMGNKEKIWVEITEVFGSIPKKFKGRVDVYPTLLDDLKFGDSVAFEESIVLDLLKN